MSESNILKKTSKSLPFKWYFDDGHYKKELNKIWNNEWIYACHENNLKDPLCYITIRLANYNILILKDKNNTIKAYLNTCRHRGSIICDKDSGKLRSNILVCPYHQWSYDGSNGKLIKTSSFKIPKNFKTSDYSLKIIKIKIWNGLIFFNFNDSPIKWNNLNTFQDYDPVINKIDLDNFHVGYIWKKIINCNWKIFWENYSECLHCPNVHPNLSKLVPVYKRRLVDIKDDPNWKKLLKSNKPEFQSGLRKGAETWSVDGSAQGHKINFFKKSKKFPGHIYLTSWPSMFLVIFVDHIRIVRILPINNEKTEITSEWLFESKTMNDKKYNKNNVIDFAIEVMKEDSAACELNQKGVHNFISHSGILMPEEYEIKKFHDWIRKKC
tara:strand:- start:295 stop:1440 length:1146 start_codon:yes stop_codon:yes gene_type:complete